LGKTDEKEVPGILEVAWENKIHTIDTARSYGNSESVLGKFLHHPFRIVTKFPPGTDSPEKLYASFAGSCNDLKVDRLYAFLAHNADSLRGNKDLWNALLQLKEKGLVQKIGYSLYTPQQLIQLIDSGMTPDIIQIPYNFLDQRFNKLLPQLKANGIEIHVRSVFLQGLFFMDPDTLSEFFNPVKSLIKTLQSNFTRKNELAAWLMQFALNEQNIDKVVFGVNNTNQLKDNLSGLMNSSSVKISVENNIPEEILMPNLWPQN
jgi:aryl-alcohol dehydrogenase-like predicted oxidoreductase